MNTLYCFLEQNILTPESTPLKSWALNSMKKKWLVLYFMLRRDDRLYPDLFICILGFFKKGFPTECMFWWVQDSLMEESFYGRSVDLLLLCALHWLCVLEASWRLRGDLESRRAWEPCCDWSLSEHWCHFPCRAGVVPLGYDHSWQPASRGRCPAYYPSWNTHSLYWSEKL